MTNETVEEKSQRRAAAWMKHREWLSWYFPDQDDEYAHEMSRVAEGGKRETERSSPHEIKREMKLLTDIEMLVYVIRGLVVAAICVFPFLWQPPFMESDTTLAGWTRVAWVVLFWILAAVIGNRPFWDNYFSVLRQARMQRFWEWHSANLRFPIAGTIPSGLFEGSELHEEASQLQTKPPYLHN